MKTVIDMLGVNPTSLAKSPYRPIFLNAKDILARDISIEANNEAVLSIIPSVSSYVGGDIYISQKDIRQIQLAKGAIAAGVLLMLAEIGLEIEMISKVYIAGAFGYHVNPDNIKIIGLIPKGFNGEIVFLGNTSLEGAKLALINKECFKNLYNIKKDMEVLDLSFKKNFQDIFVSQLNF